MPRVYATSTDYQAHTGQTPPATIDQLLADATRMLEARVLRLCWYEVDEDGMPTNATVLETIRAAVCSQAHWWVQVGDSTGAVGVGWSSVGIGSVNLSRAGPAVSGEDSPARQIAPSVWDALQSPDLTPDIFSAGVVASW